MSVLLDTGVLYAHHDTDAARTDDAEAFMDSLLDGVYGQPYVNDYVYDEAVTMTLRRTGQFSAAQNLADRIRGAGDFPSVFDLLFVDRTRFTETVTVFEKYPDQDLSFTDASLIATVENEAIDAIASFDSDSDGIVDRICPGAESDLDAHLGS